MIFGTKIAKIVFSFLSNFVFEAIFYKMTFFIAILTGFVLFACFVSISNINTSKKGV